METVEDGSGCSGGDVGVGGRRRRRSDAEREKNGAKEMGSAGVWVSLKNGSVGRAVENKKWKKKNGGDPKKQKWEGKKTKRKREMRRERRGKR